MWSVTFHCVFESWHHKTSRLRRRQKPKPMHTSSSPHERLPAHSSHALTSRPDSPQTDNSQWQRFCLFQRDCLLTQKDLFGWSNNLSMIKLLYLGKLRTIKTRRTWFSVCIFILEDTKTIRQERRGLKSPYTNKFVSAGTGHHVDSIKWLRSVQGRLIASQSDVVGLLW